MLVKDLTRRELLSNLIILPALAGLAIATGAVAEAKGSKAQFQYQDHPNGNQACKGCSYFTAGKTATAGTCQVVAGPISPNGWCTAYAAKA